MFSCMDVNPVTKFEDMVLKRVFYALLHYRLHCSCFSSFPSVHTSIIMFYFHFFQPAVHLFHFIYHSTSHSHLPYLMAICKSRNGESGNGMRGWWHGENQVGNAGNQGGSDGNQGGNVGMRGIRVGMMGMRGFRVRMRGMQGIRVGMRGTRVKIFA